MSRKLKSLKRAIGKLSTEEKAAFDAAVLTGRGNNPVGVSDAEWNIVWSSNAAVERGRRHIIEGFVGEAFTLSPANYAEVTAVTPIGTGTDWTKIITVSIVAITVLIVAITVLILVMRVPNIISTVKSNDDKAPKVVVDNKKVGKLQKELDDLKKKVADNKSTTATPPADETAKPDIKIEDVDMTTDSARIIAAINTGGLVTKYYVEYGSSSTSLDKQMVSKELPADGEKVVKIDLSDLISGKKYFYRVSASNAKGTSSLVKNFTTEATSTPNPNPGSSAFTDNDLNIGVTMANDLLTITGNMVNGKSFPSGTKYAAYLNGSFYSVQGWMDWDNNGNSVKIGYPGGVVQIRLQIKFPSGPTLDSRVVQYPQ